MKRVGQGRSATVFLARDGEGARIAREVFTGSRTANLVHYVLNGAPNPYTWCEAAIRTAIARRRVLAPLVRFWFDDRLRLPATGNWSWDDAHRAFALDAEFIDGHHLRLRGPGTDAKSDRLPELLDDVLAPLQQRLRESGFDGLVWQAGLGHPVGAANFMLEHPVDAKPRWVWVDLESGVPALFALNPIETIRFYLPRSFHHRRWLFDDVDVPELRAYVASRRTALDRAIGVETRDRLERDIGELDEQQTRWRSIRRHERSIGSELARGRITTADADRYRTRPVRWYARMLGVAARRGAHRIAAFAHDGLGWIRAQDFPRLAQRLWLFSISQRFRSHVARRYVASRVRGWQRRRFLDREIAQTLRGQLRHDETGAYITDFGVHLAIKPLMKTLQWGVVPSLFAVGIIGPLAMGMLIVMGGAIGRTVYTSGRIVHATFTHRPRPWLALVVGVLPVVGNAAFPIQLLSCTADERSAIARFIVYDTFAGAGRSIPIWGGRDTLLEHRFNRLGAHVIRWCRAPRRGRARSGLGKPVVVD